MAKRSTKLEALNDIFKENGIDRDSIPIRDDLTRVLKKNADAIPDYRHPSYIWHLVGDIVMIVFFVLLGNADQWGEIESFAKQKEKWLRKYLELPNGIPTDDTIRIVMGNINTEHFSGWLSACCWKRLTGSRAFQEKKPMKKKSSAWM